MLQAGEGTNGTGEVGRENTLGLFLRIAICGTKGTAGAGEEAGKPLEGVGNGHWEDREARSLGMGKGDVSGDLREAVSTSSPPPTLH